jgi:plastocyanin
MRLALVWSFVLAVALTAAEQVDVRGIVRVGETPEPNAVVWLEAADAPPPAEGTSRALVLDQRNLSFAPHVLAVPVGATVAFPNNDRVFHNVFSFRDGKRFDLGLYPVGTVKRIQFDKPGLSRIFCNIHPQMAAYVLAVDSPHFAVSDDDGRFTIKGVPAGTYTYHAWRAGAQPVSGSTTIGSGTTLQVGWP